MRQQSLSLPDPDLWARCFGATYPARFSVGEHRHSWDQLTLTESGAVRVIAGDRAWLVPSHHALWVPADTPHDLITFGPVALRTMYFHPGTVDALPRACRAIEVSPLLRELVLHAIRRGRLRRSDPHESTCLELLRQVLGAQPAAELSLPLPVDPRGARAAQLILDDPGAHGDLRALALEVHASRRTLERIFLGETGISLGLWRQRVRLLASLSHLANGTSVGQVADLVGYKSPSAFVGAFREVFGVTPRKFATGSPVTRS